MAVGRSLMALLLTVPVAVAPLAVATAPVPATASAVVGPVPGASQAGHVGAAVVRRTGTTEVGVRRPVGLAWSARSGDLVLASRTRIVRLDSSGRRLEGARAADRRLDRAPRAGTLSVSPVTGAASYAVGRRLVTLVTDRRARAGSTRLPHDARDVQGVGHDPTGAVWLLDGSRLVRHRPDGRWTPTVIRDRSGRRVTHALRGLTWWPAGRHWLTYDRDARALLGVDRKGREVARYDARAAHLHRVTGLAVAPSADTTDPDGLRDVYVADAGARGSSGGIVELSLAATAAAVTTVTGTVVRSVQTSQFSPPSPDPSGIAYVPDTDRLWIADGEVDEMSIFRGANLFETTRAGVLSRTGVTQPWSDEPTGAAYNPVNRHLLVSDDDDREVYDVAAGADTRYGSADDTVTHFDTAVAGNGDTEDVAYDPVSASVWTIDGVNREVYRFRAGPDGTLGTSDDIHSSFDVGVLGAQDPEGIVYDAVRDTLVVLDDKADRIFELDRQGALLNSIDISSANMVAAAGVTIAPGTDDPSARHYYVVARGIDNNSQSSENDGMLYEVAAPLPAIGAGGNQGPYVDAGPDQVVVLPGSATLDGFVTDDGRPNPPGTTTASWSQVSGPGTATFANASSPDTTASFTVDGTYVLRLTAFDGELTTTDDLTVTVMPVGSPVAVETSVAASSDDAEQSSSGSVSLTSSDLELVTDGTKVQTVGIRFASVPVPAGSAVTRAWVQFQTDEVSSDAASLTIQAEAADNTPTYQSTSGNLTSRAVTQEKVSWTPPAWSVVGERAAAQRTPDLATLVQAVVGRSGWASGHSLAFRITGSGRRTAEAFDGTFAPLLHVEFSNGGPPVNRPPTVSAGPDLSVVLPAGATLDGTVTDDGLPGSGVTQRWTEVSGPGTVAFGDVTAVDTTATFPGEGEYLLRLTASDGELSASDDVVVTVRQAGTVQTFTTAVATGSDDAEERDTGSVSLTSGDLDMFLDHTKVIRLVGLRFAGVVIPKGAVVDSAYVQFTSDEVGTGTASFVVRAQAGDNASTFAGTSGNLSGRPVTTESVTWSPADWTAVGLAGAAQRTSNLAPLLQAVVNRSGWSSGNALVLLVSGTGLRTADSFEGAHAARLVVEWH